MLLISFPMKCYCVVKCKVLENDGGRMIDFLISKASDPQCIFRQVLSHNSNIKVDYIIDGD